MKKEYLAKGIQTDKEINRDGAKASSKERNLTMTTKSAPGKSFVIPSVLSIELACCSNLYKILLKMIRN